MTAAKLGLDRMEPDDLPLARELFTLMQQAELDMTIWFRTLARLDGEAPDLALFDDAFYRPEARETHGVALSRWLERYAARLRRDDLSPDQRRQRMNSVNPRFVPRNYLAQQAIDQAERGQLAPLQQLMAILRKPYDEQPEHAEFAARRPDWARHRAGCSMLSCSS